EQTTRYTGGFDLLATNWQQNYQLSLYALVNMDCNSFSVFGYKCPYVFAVVVISECPKCFDIVYNCTLLLINSVACEWRRLCTRIGLTFALSMPILNCLLTLASVIGFAILLTVKIKSSLLTYSNFSI